MHAEAWYNNIMILIVMWLSSSYSNTVGFQTRPKASTLLKDLVYNSYYGYHYVVDIHYKQCHAPL